MNVELPDATDLAIAHAHERVQFGRPLASFQALQFRLVECHWRLLGLRLLVREAGWRADRNDGRAYVVSALAWLYARDVGRLVTKHTPQIFGAIGFTREMGLTTVTGSAATLRALYPARDAAVVVRAGRALGRRRAPIDDPRRIPDGSPGGSGMSTAGITGDRVGNWGRWGDDDQLGAVNLLTPEKVMQAM